jgi:hypothetical protein
MSTWRKTTDGRMECTACGAFFDVGRACSCTGSSLPTAVSVSVSQPSGVAEGGDLSAAPRRKRGGQPLVAVLSTRDVAIATADVARRARATYTRIAKIDLDAAPPFEGAPSPGALELTMRRTQLLALDTTLKALRLAGAQAELREGAERLDRLESTAKAVKAIRDGARREELLQ